MAAPASLTVRLQKLGALAAVALAAGVLALAPAAGASAHDYLVSSTPAANSTETKALSKIVLTFDDRVLDLSGDGSSNVVEVTGPGGKHFEAGCPTIADIDVSVPVKLGASGAYTVRWQIVSADGHVVTNSIGFRYDKPADAIAAVGKASRPTCGDQNAGSGTSASTAAGSSASGATSSASSGLPIALGVGGGIIVLALIAVAVVLVRSSRAAAAAAGAASDAAPRPRAARSRRKPPPPPTD
ncbi:MAG: transport integral rane protein [Frondihabitans sp.]|nr:transport integral rane protein [Frondihabitans sp.]